MSTSAKPELLFLAHLLPWPLEGGGQIKSYQALRLLASRFDVTLLAFVRGGGETENVAPLHALCTGGLTAVPLSRSRWRDLAALARAVGTGGSLLIARDHSPAMHAAVRQALSGAAFAAVHVDHLQMMAFLPPPSDLLLTKTRIVLDQHNVEHHILRKLTEIDRGVSPLMKWAARWDLPRLRKFEQDACRRADRVLAVSEEDAAAIRKLLADGKSTESIDKVRVTPIGVDTEHFAPVTPTADPNVHPILSVGTMYWPPNVDAAQWFCAEILPLIHRSLPDARFQVVGAKPARAVRALAAAQPEVVTVTGTVPDVRPYMAGCGVFVVPLRAGSGMRVKILHAMAMGLPIVSTALGAEGIAVAHGENILLADTPTDFADAVVRVLTDRALAARLGQAARELAVRRYSVKAAEEPLLRVYEEMFAT